MSRNPVINKAQFNIMVLQFHSHCKIYAPVIIIFIFTMKKVIPSELVQMSLSNISTNDLIPPPMQAECRFCKKTRNPQNSLNQFLSPCSCLEPIHSYCLADEMQKSTRGEIASRRSQKHYTCHKCQANIRFHFQSSHQCRSGQEIRQFAKERKCFCFWLVLCITIMILLLVFIIVIKATNTKIDCMTLTNTTIIGVSILVIVLFLISTFFCLTQVVYAQKRKVNLLNSNSKQRRKFNRELQIVDCP